MGSMIPWIERNGDYHYPFALWSSGYVELYFQYQAAKIPFDSRELRMELLERFNSIDGVSLPENSINRRPSIKFEVLARDENLNKFLDVITWYLEKVKEGS